MGNTTGWPTHKAKERERQRQTPNKDAAQDPQHEKSHATFTRSRKEPTP